MKIICLLLCTLSLSSARVYPRTEVNDDLNGVEGLIYAIPEYKDLNGVEGLVYDIPEYEDSEAILFKLLARGVMPIFTVRDTVKDLKDLSKKNDTPHHQTDDITKGLDTVITQLQEAKNKLESGNKAIYFDIDKSVLSLENLKQHLYTDLHNASTEASLIYNATTERPLIYNASTERPLINNVSTELYPVNDASTKQPFVMKEAVFAHVPAAEFSSDEEEVKTDIADGAVSSAEADKLSGESIQHFDSDSTLENEPERSSASEQENRLYFYSLMPPVPSFGQNSNYLKEVEEGDKALIRKKWSYKLSSLF